MVFEDCAFNFFRKNCILYYELNYMRKMLKYAHLFTFKTIQTAHFKLEFENNQANNNKKFVD